MIAFTTSRFSDRCLIFSSRTTSSMDHSTLPFMNLMTRRMNGTNHSLKPHFSFVLVTSNRFMAYVSTTFSNPNDALNPSRLTRNSKWTHLCCFTKTNETVRKDRPKQTLTLRSQNRFSFFQAPDAFDSRLRMNVIELANSSNEY